MYVLVTYVFHVWLHLILTKRSSHIEQNLRPKFDSCQSLATCHWSLNSISALMLLKDPF